MAVTLDQVRTMRIGLVVDSACDLPKDFIERHSIEILPIAVRIDGTTQVDYRDQPATLAFLDSTIPERGVTAETIPYTVQQFRDLFHHKNVHNYDSVSCSTTHHTPPHLPEPHKK